MYEIFQSYKSSCYQLVFFTDIELLSEINNKASESPESDSIALKYLSQLNNKLSESPESANYFLPNPHIHFATLLCYGKLCRY